MFTAVPRSEGISSRLRYKVARSEFHDLKTASIDAMRCSRGSVGKSFPVATSITFMKPSASAFKPSTSRSCKLAVLLADKTRV
ncbi:unannotated protein [freshwater metagenome]|uniref:Unannotated protein n=1 Tax=freshwater metagenome TaxID=449393 RepID=A0A6J6JEF2_9ZZZZ